MWIHMSGIYLISAPRNNPSYIHRKIVIKIQRKKTLLFSRRQSLQHKSLEGVINWLLSVVAILQVYCFNCLNFKLEKISAFPVLSVHTHTQELFSNFIFLVNCKMFYYNMYQSIWILLDCLDLKMILYMLSVCMYYVAHAL